VTLRRRRCSTRGYSKDSGSETLLWWAAAIGHEAVVKLLLDKKGVDSDSKDRYGRTPLWGVAAIGREAVVKLLLDKEGAYPDSKGRDGKTPLRWATRNGHEAMVKLLQSRGAVSHDLCFYSASSPPTSCCWAPLICYLDVVREVMISRTWLSLRIFPSRSQVGIWVKNRKDRPSAAYAIHSTSKYERARKCPTSLYLRLLQASALVSDG
jgi:hypothetical protein